MSRKPIKLRGHGVSIRIPVEAWDLLKPYAKLRGVSMERSVQYAIEQFVKHDGMTEAVAQFCATAGENGMQGMKGDVI